MKAIRELSDKNNRQGHLLIGSLPIIVGALVLLCTKAVSWLLFWLSQNKMPKGGLSAFIIGYFVEGIFQIIPFVAIGYFIRGSISKDTTNKELYVRMMFMLLPVAFVTAYWLFVHINPFARGGLLFLNLFLVFIGHLLGKAVYRNNVTVANKPL